MARIIKMEEIRERDLIKFIKDGKIIVYPTDTIYGIGCDATNGKSVQKIREIKNRTEKPFSIIAPSRQWVYDNFEVNNKNYIEKLPGPYTFVLKTKKERIVSHHANNGDTMGVRIPNHKITEMIQRAQTPFITTSVNLAGEEPASDIKNIPRKILKQADLIIDGGALNKEASVLIDLTGETPRIIRRV